jgi:glycosyltransferase domain-containing protein
MPTRKLLTTLLPTRNRPHNIAGQLALFKNAGIDLLIADSSDAAKSTEVKAAAAGGATGRLLSYPPETGFFDKLAAAVAHIETPFVLLAADRKITFPHAAEAALAFLQEHHDYAAAQGYVIGFAVHGDDIDINRIVYYTPGIAEAEPLQRHYHLMRRYQSRQFSVFRLQPLIAAIAQARKVAGAMFQEIMFMNALVLQGKVARLPNILTLQTVEESFNRLRDIDPVHWFLNDAQSFYRHYEHYRIVLVDFISENAMAEVAGGALHQLLDVVHAVWLSYTFDNGVLNFAAQQLLEHHALNMPHPRPPIPWQDIRAGDRVNPSCQKRRFLIDARRDNRRYVWRREVLDAEPREEISISSDEIGKVEAQLEVYFDR